MDRDVYSLTTFSREGKLGQLDCALKAVSLGGQCVGIKAKDGVVIACEAKPVSTLVEKRGNFKVQKINDKVGMVYSGNSPDYLLILQEVRKASTKYATRLGVDMPTREVVKSAAKIMQQYTQMGGVRPFGVSLLIIGYENKAPTLWQVDPSGSYWAWKAAALGKRADNSNTYLERTYNEEYGLDDAIDTAINTLKEGFDGQLTEDLIEIGIVNADGFKTYTPNEIKEFLNDHK